MVCFRGDRAIGGFYDDVCFDPVCIRGVDLVFQCSWNQNFDIQFKQFFIGNAAYSVFTVIFQQISAVFGQVFEDGRDIQAVLLVDSAGYVADGHYFHAFFVKEFCSYASYITHSLNGRGCSIRILAQLLEDVFGGEHYAAACRLVTPERAPEFNWLSGNNAMYTVAL